MIGAIGTIAELTDDEQSQLNELVSVWTSKLARNMLRSQYYDQKNLLEDLGIGIPPHMTNINAVLGWPAKAVDVIARRCKFEAFTAPGVDGDALGLDELVTESGLALLLPQAITSAFLHSCTFVMTTAGGPGEPDVVVSAYSAKYASGTWDQRRQQLKTALAITDLDDLGRISGFLLFVPGRTITAKRTPTGGGWEVDKADHTLDRIPVEVLAYQPQLDRPFGKSRITRAVMGLADSAFRTMVRLEGHAEFFSAPQRYVLGADESMFMDEAGNPISQWKAVMGRIWLAPTDEDGNTPQLGQFSPSSPTPHVEQIRTLASLFCGETSLPLSALGIVHDNPASAEAIEAAERDLIIEARYAMEGFGPRLVRIAQNSIEIRDGELPDIARRLSARWSAPENPLQSAAADAVVKVVGAMPWLQDSQIPLEMLDWDEATIRRALADKRKAGVTQLLQGLTNGGFAGGATADPGPGGQPGAEPTA